MDREYLLFSVGELICDAALTFVNDAPPLFDCTLFLTNFPLSLLTLYLSLISLFGIIYTSKKRLDPLS